MPKAKKKLADLERVLDVEHLAVVTVDVESLTGGYDRWISRPTYLVHPTRLHELGGADTLAIRDLHKVRNRSGNPAFWDPQPYTLDRKLTDFLGMDNVFDSSPDSLLTCGDILETILWQLAGDDVEVETSGQAGGLVVFTLPNSKLRAFKTKLIQVLHLCASLEFMYENDDD